jgi:hypothetical protein
MGRERISSPSRLENMQKRMRSIISQTRARSFSSVMTVSRQWGTLRQSPVARPVPHPDLKQVFGKPSAAARLAGGRKLRAAPIRSPFAPGAASDTPGGNIAFAQENP